MKKLFRGEYRSVWDYLLHLGPLRAMVLINAISVAVSAVALWLVKWFTHR